MKAREGHTLTGSLITSIPQQIVAGLDYVHTSGYFHRDLKSEYILVTMIGLSNTTPCSPPAPPDASRGRDIVCIIKLADFSHAWEAPSWPPYMECVSTRWYRAPEVLLLSRDYSTPVDIWASGAMTVELVNLRSLFPGSDQINQVRRICEILDDTDIDGWNRSIGGGPWHRGIEMAEAVRFGLPKMKSEETHSLFRRTIPTSIVDLFERTVPTGPDL